jgi:hypothetical protein
MKGTSKHQRLNESKLSTKITIQYLSSINKGGYKLSVIDASFLHIIIYLTIFVLVNEKKIHPHDCIA